MEQEKNPTGLFVFYLHIILNAGPDLSFDVRTRKEFRCGQKSDPDSQQVNGNDSINDLVVGARNNSSNDLQVALLSYLLPNANGRTSGPTKAHFDKKSTLPSLRVGESYKPRLG